jgi:hypothetical protein
MISADQTRQAGSGVAEGIHCAAPFFEIVRLAEPGQQMRYCEVCDREEIFVVGWECKLGRIGVCLGCGDEKIAPFTRVNSEVAG